MALQLFYCAHHATHDQFRVHVVANAYCETVRVFVFCEINIVISFVHFHIRELCSLFFFYRNRWLFSHLFSFHFHHFLTGIDYAIFSLLFYIQFMLCRNYLLQFFAGSASDLLLFRILVAILLIGFGLFTPGNFPRICRICFLVSKLGPPDLLL